MARAASPYSVVRTSTSSSFEGSGAQTRRAGGGRVTSLALIPAHGAGQMSDGWMGAGLPMNPMAQEAAGRRWDYPIGANLYTNPRANEPVSYADLRQLADKYDILRLVIETRKDQMARLKWAITPKDDKQELTGEIGARAKRITDLFVRPDRENFWGSWLRSILEDLLVIDAATLYVRRTRDGKSIYSLDQIDGATIKRVITDMGRTPEPPAAAYQQVLKGMPAVNYTSRDMIYRPRNMRVNRFYGFSPVEQLLMLTNIALRRQMWQLSYFTDGNLPDSLIGVPSTWTPDQIRQFQAWFDSKLSGNTSAKRGATFVPGEVAKSYVPTKEAELFGHAEEWMARMVCYCFGVSHQALVKEVNRATADSARQQAMEDGLAPVMAWVKELIDTILIDQMGETELEFEWIDDKELDPKVAAEIQKSLLGVVCTINEVREERGLEPSKDPEADMLGMFGLDGTFTPLSLEEQISRKGQMMDAFPPPPPVTPVGGDGQSVPAPAATNKPAAAPEKGQPRAQTSAEGGEAGGRSSGAAAKSATGDAPADGLPVSVTHADTQRVRLRVAKKVARALGATQILVEAQVRRFLRSHLDKVAKDDRTHTVLSAAEVDMMTRELDLSPLEDLMVADDYAAVASGTAARALAMVGVSDHEDLVNRVNLRAVAQAQQKAAALVGRRVLDDGSVIDNPDPAWSITESTRTMIRDMITQKLEENAGSDAIVSALEDDFAFSPSRADMVSRTEIADVNSSAAMDAYRGAVEIGVDVEKEWILGAEPCPICEENAADGAIPLDQDFSSGDDTAPAHPNCECAVVPVVGDGAPDAEEGDL